MTSKKRRFSRIVFNVEAKLTVGGEVYTVERISNLSVGGCLLEVKDSLPLKSNCIFTLFLSEKAASVDVQGEIVRVGSGEISLKFTTISQDNLFHLQNIIRYNSENPDAIEKEISAHPGLK